MFTTSNKGHRLPRL